MAQHLVIVESPAKAKTIKKYLGKEYEVLASYGHVRDLPARKGSVNPEDTFKMTYTLIERNARHVDAIAKALKHADDLLLATDPDREGEAISWHIFELMNQRNLLKGKTVRRIIFNEITKSAIVEAIHHPRDISMDLVNAQQARRALDYLVGFNLSPLLWKKVRRGLSAGRVQSPALRLIAEREDEIERFISQEYWRVFALSEADGRAFEARLTYFHHTKQHQFSLVDEKTALAVQANLIEEAKGFLTVVAVDKKQRKRQPSPPFITSTLQQEASRKLGFTARKTMIVAQQLYEGIDIGTGTVGLISYMRTDSVVLSTEAIQDIRNYIQEKFSTDHLPKQARQYKTKSKNAQEAHEAIRPTSILRIPEKIKESLTVEQFKLYRLIWLRALASQMTDALLDTVSIDFSAGEGNVFRANGSVIVFPGFLSIYEEGSDDISTDNNDISLPPLEQGMILPLKDIRTSQHFTEPPPRYSEASLVKALEEFDIGRPSTYASIIHTLLQREYVILEKKRFLPTDVGRIVNRFLVNYFTTYVDYQFTAQLEAHLDDIARGEKEWIPVLSDFWGAFIHQIDEIDERIKRQDVTTELLEDLCPKCGKILSIRLGKRGRFIGCTGYPECDYTQDMAGGDAQSSTKEPTVVEGRVCPECTHPLWIRIGKYGRFVGCSQYPTCKFIEPLEKPEDTQVVCPDCQKGHLLKRKSRRGKIFYSCADYPRCKYALWNEPIARPCPNCQFPILTLKETKRHGVQYICPKEGCGYAVSE